MQPKLPADEVVTKPASELAVGDRVLGDLLPLGVPGEVLYRRLFERDRSEWMFVAFVQWDGHHDSTTFLASAPVRVRVAEPQRVADPTGLAYTRADDDLDEFIATANADMAEALDKVVDTEAGLQRVKESVRVPPHTGAVTDEGLVDETPTRMHFSEQGNWTACSLPIGGGRSPADEGWTNVGGQVTCKSCLDSLAL